MSQCLRLTDMYYYVGIPDFSRIPSCSSSMGSLPLTASTNPRVVELQLRVDVEVPPHYLEVDVYLALATLAPCQILKLKPRSKGQF